MQTTDDVVAKAARGEYSRKPRRKHKGLCTAVAVIAATMLAGAIVWFLQPHKPSAQCRSQIAQVAALQADARAIEMEPSPDWVQFNAYTAQSGAILKLMGQERCPHSGYKDGFTY